MLTTNELTALVATLRTRGVRFREEPAKHPWGGAAIVDALYGNSIVLVGPLQSDSSSR